MEYLQELIQSGFKGEEAFNKLQIRYRELVKEKERYRLRLSLLEQAIRQDYDSMMIIGPGWNSSGYEIIYVNEAFTAMTGYSADEVAGCSMSILQSANTDPSILNKQRKRMNKGLSFHGEAVACRKNGSEFLLKWDIHPLTNNDGGITHWVAYQSEVSSEGNSWVNSSRSLTDIQIEGIEKCLNPLIDHQFSKN